MSDETLHAIRSLRPPAAAKGRARRDGVPSSAEVAALLGALSPAWWQPMAELQLRLGLRRAEVCAIGPDWIDEAAGMVHLRVCASTPSIDRDSWLLVSNPSATRRWLAGVPLSVVRDRMGHASETTTERHYIGHTAEPVASPFAAIARWSRMN